MASNLSATQRENLARHNAEHVPCYWLQVTEYDVLELTEGRVPDTVRQLARWLAEDLETMLARQAARRTAAKRKRI